MATVAEVLRESGFTDEQIAAMDQRAITAFTGVLTEADKQRAEAKVAQDAAELAQRSNVDFYENKIVPSLTQWEEEKQRIENERATAAAQAAFYRTQAEEAKKSGFIAADAPGFDPAKFVPPNPVQPRDNQGRYVAGAPGATPGSPTFNVNEFAAKAGDAMGIIADISWAHQSLFGKPLPISPTQLIAQADALKLDPMTYASRTFNFDGRRQQMQQEEEKAKADKIAAEARAPLEAQLKEKDEQLKKDLAENDRKWAERVGSNPDLRRPQENAKYTDIQRGISNKEIPDPLMLNDQQRRALTSTMIRKDIAETANV
jgi:hypothetical protein